MTILAYLRSELKFSGPEWMRLTDKDKADLRMWAEEEMTLLGIEVK